MLAPWRTWQILHDFSATLPRWWKMKEKWTFVPVISEIIVKLLKLLKRERESQGNDASGYEFMKALTSSFKVWFQTTTFLVIILIARPKQVGWKGHVIVNKMWRLRAFLLRWLWMGPCTEFTWLDFWGNVGCGIQKSSLPFLWFDKVSWLLLRAKYRKAHLAACVVCLCGLGSLIALRRAFHVIVQSLINSISQLHIVRSEVEGSAFHVGASKLHLLFVEWPRMVPNRICSISTHWQRCHCKNF